ncbi:3-deoxy-7-phosphoheptulonate synthase [Carboxydocella sp. JDF658]|uniref:3-deoxy-7-phosphoheptulonate synthase n=1 Tax=Carboxydocella sp. JDF658 TaxID=1926600 RepID=UPI0009C8F067|nr:3-deoxy-7-phosphoheptulonate synthase [Carboxydocella sp. JDF658]AVX30819.1 3-deoxy-D-arabinoheptulosonate-7-phosphate synthase [Carboxydocella thermautotrophica]GAW32469.1 3-deoxy-7-phosphoheptulonate synthase [Carboxydocella sp. JDF658]
MTPLKLVARQHLDQATVVTINEELKVGDREIIVMAGPCAVESKEQLLAAAYAVKEGGARVLRGGAFKPRTSPYAFQGLMEEGLKLLAETRRETGLPVVTEVMDTRDLELVAEYADILQIGSRNMQNFALLKEAGRIGKPILLKRGLAATIEEWLLAAEYIMSQGNDQIILCERGIRTFETATRNTLDLSAVAVVKEVSHLPVIVDPSHATGRWQLVAAMAKGAIAAGADGLLIEVHPNPAEALCDGPQSLTPANFHKLMQDLQKIAQAIGREIAI